MPVTSLGLSPAAGTAAPSRPLARKPKSGASKPTSRILRTSLTAPWVSAPGPQRTVAGGATRARGGSGPLVAEVVGENEYAKAGAAQGEVEGLGVDLLGLLAVAGVE